MNHRGYEQRKAGSRQLDAATPLLKNRSLFFPSLSFILSSFEPIIFSVSFIFLLFICLSLTLPQLSGLSLFQRQMAWQQRILTGRWPWISLVRTSLPCPSKGKEISLAGMRNAFYKSSAVHGGYPPHFSTRRIIVNELLCLCVFKNRTDVRIFVAEALRQGVTQKAQLGLPPGCQC